MESVLEALGPRSVIADLQGRPVISGGMLHSSSFIESANVSAIVKLHRQFADGRHAPVMMAGCR